MTPHIRKDRALAVQQRALSVVGWPIKYGWGKGGFDPRSRTPADEKGRCDCSGFAAWCYMLSRKPKPARPWWLGTDNIYADATRRQAVFIPLPGPEVGALIVYPRYLLRAGHVGVIVATDGERFRMVDCSSGMQRRTGKAIHERDGAFMLRARGKPAVFCTLKEWIH